MRASTALLICWIGSGASASIFSRRKPTSRLGGTSHGNRLVSIRYAITPTEKTSWLAFATDGVCNLEGGLKRAAPMFQNVMSGCGMFRPVTEVENCGLLAGR